MGESRVIYKITSDPLKSWVFMGSDLVKWGFVDSPPWVGGQNTSKNGFWECKVVCFDFKNAGILGRFDAREGCWKVV